MKLILTILIALAIGGSVYYVMTSQGTGVQTESRDAANNAKAAADAYKKNQEDMMRQLQQ